MSLRTTLIPVLFITILMYPFRSYSITDATRNCVLVSLQSDRNPLATSSLNIIRFCKNCRDPTHEGSFVPALIAAQGPKEFNVTASELVYAIPNAGEGGQLWNGNDLMNRIVLIDRGKEVTIAKKIEMVQEAGGLGVIIVDDGTCDEDFNYCGRRTGSKSAGGFGAWDYWRSWEAIDIPGLLITKENGEKMKEMLWLQKTNILGIGEQWIGIHDA